MEAKYPQETASVVCSFLFLKFFCPVVFDPVSYGIISEIPSQEAGRALVLVSKILQVLANNSRFGTTGKSNLSMINPFLESYEARICAFAVDFSV